MVNDECYRSLLPDEPELPVSVPPEPEPPELAPEPAAVPVPASPVCAPAAVPSVLPGVVPELVGSVVVGELLISDVASCNVHTVFMNVSSAMNSYSGLPDTAPVINTFDVLFGQYGPAMAPESGTNFKCNMMVAVVCRHSVRIKIFGCQH